MMRVFCLYIFIGLSQIACSQNETRINKTCDFEGSASFPSKSYTCQKLGYSNQQLVWEVNYSNNGWQVYDSLYHEIKGSKYCIKTFLPLYDEGSKIVLKYNTGDVDCEQPKGISNKFLASVRDQYFLTKPYLDDLNFLLELTPINQNNNFKFETPISPSLFSRYGVPYDELLSSFSFVVGEIKLIESDNFYFLGFTLKRDYQYEKRRLKTVVITLVNKNTNSSTVFNEYFEVMN